MTALRRWPDELGHLPNKDLAARVGISPQSLSAVLQNGTGWKATPRLLEQALRIIDICGGEAQDLTNWTTYHDRVVAYQATRQPPAPKPPEPVRLAAARSSHPARAGLFEKQRQLGTMYLPSALLRADYAIVPFEHRQDDLARLLAWAEGDEPVSPLLVTAAGGQGKSRLAMKLCEVLRARGWLAEFLADDAAADLLEADSALEPRTLLVIDYAEGRTSQVVAALTATSALTRGRVLLLSRSAGEWQDDLLDTDDELVAALLAGMPEAALSPLVVTEDRAVEFARAVQAFAHRFDVPASTVAAPEDLETPRYETALDIHAAALAGVLDQVEPDVRGPGWTDPVLRVLRHERRYWQRTTPAYHLVDAHHHRLDQVVATGTLFGAADQKSALRLLAALPTFAGQPADVVDRFARWSADLYQGSGLLNGMRPDRLGEDHAANTLKRRPDLAAELVAVAGSAQTVQALTVLGRAAPRHTHLGEVVTSLVRAEPGRLLRLGMQVAPTLDDPAALTGALSTVVREVSDTALVDDLVTTVSPTSTALAEFAAATTRRALDLRADGEHDPAEMAALLGEHGHRLINVGEYETALPVLVRAEAAYRELPADPEQALKAGLADVLSDLANALYGLGHYAEALDRSREGVAVLQELVGVDHDRGHEYVAASIELTKHLLANGATGEALDVVSATVTTCTDLVADDYGFLPGLAGALEQQGYALDQSGRTEEGCAALERAATIYRLLADEFPDEFADVFTGLLSNLSGFLHDLDRVDEGLALAREALDTAERLVATYGERFEPALANVHNNRAIVLGRYRRHEEAEHELAVAVGIFRRLADRRPEAYLSELARTLGNHALHLRKLGRLTEALEDDTEALDIFRKLADPRPDQHLPDVVDALIRLYLDHEEAGDLHRAHEAISEAVAIAEQLRLTAPDRSRPQFAQATQHFTTSLLTLGRTVEAVTAAASSLQAARVLADGQPKVFERLPAEGAHLLALAQAGSGRHRKALHAYGEALGRYRRIAAREADPHTLVSIAHVYMDMAVTQRALGDRRGGTERALRTNGEAERIYRAQITDNDGLAGGLAHTLANRAALLVDASRTREAVTTVTEAIDLYRQAYEADPDLFRLGLWMALRHKATLTGGREAVRLLAEAHRLVADADEVTRSGMLDDLTTDLAGYPSALVREAWPDCPLTSG